MAGAALLGRPVTVSAAPLTARIEWRAARVARVTRETSTARTLVLDVPGWPGHRAGQHVDVRLTAEDGYQTQRSYSIASAPQDEQLALTIERLEDGEVSSYLCGELREGDDVELRGPVGGYFVWEVNDGGPLMLVAGGSGIVPLMSMLRYRALALTDAGARRGIPARLLYSSRRWADVIYREELERMSAVDDSLRVIHTVTREPPPGWAGLRRRIDRDMLADVCWAPSERPRIFICGPTPLVERAATDLAALGHEHALIKTERFGPTG